MYKSQHILTKGIIKLCKGSGRLLVRLYKDNDKILGQLSQSAHQPNFGCRKSLHMPTMGLFHRHFAMESVPDPYTDFYSQCRRSFDLSEDEKMSYSKMFSNFPLSGPDFDFSEFDENLLEQR